MHAGSVKQGRIVNYHEPGRKKTAKIVAQTRAVGPHLADLDVIATVNFAEEYERPRHRVRAAVCQAIKDEILKRRRRGATLAPDARANLDFQCGRELRLLRSSSRPVPAPPPIAEALATFFGHRDRILELDEATL